MCGNLCGYLCGRFAWGCAATCADLHRRALVTIIVTNCYKGVTLCGYLCGASHFGPCAYLCGNLCDTLPAQSFQGSTDPRNGKPATR